MNETITRWSYNEAQQQQVSLFAWKVMFCASMTKWMDGGWNGVCACARYIHHTAEPSTGESGVFLLLGREVGQSAKVEKEVAVRLEKAGKVYQMWRRKVFRSCNLGKATKMRIGNICPVRCRDLASDATWHQKAEDLPDEMPSRHPRTHPVGHAPECEHP